MRRLLAVLLFVVVAPFAGVSAQEDDVALRFYLVTITQVNNYRYPTHFGARGVSADAELVGVQWQMMDYGLINTGLLAANVNAAQQTYLAGLADVQAIPANIDNTVTAGQVQNIRDRLEAFDLPGTWVNVGDSYRVVLREVCGYMQFMQRLTAITGINPTTLNIRLSMQYNAMPQLWKNAMVQTYSELGYSDENVSGTSTLRQILRDITAQNGQRAFYIGGVTL